MSCNNIGPCDVQDSEGNILDDEVLINTLNNSKLTAGQLYTAFSPLIIACTACEVVQLSLLHQS